MIWVTQIVNQPFPSKVHALTGRVNTPKRGLRVISDAGRFGQYKDVGISGRSSSGNALETRMNNDFFVVTEYPDVETWHCHV